jgi:hypothetical protein
MSLLSVLDEMGLSPELKSQILGIVSDKYGNADQLIANASYGVDSANGQTSFFWAGRIIENSTNFNDVTKAWSFGDSAFNFGAEAAAGVRISDATAS